MKTPFKTTKSPLETELDRLLNELANEEPDTERYDRIADQVAKLYKLKEVDSKNKISADTLVTAATSLAGIALIVGYEHGHALTSKALGFVIKR